MKSWPLLLVAALAAGCPKEPPTSVKAERDGAAKLDPRCVEHGIPAELCTPSNPGLAQVFKAKGDWCAEHEFPESFCPICHPDAELPNLGRPADDAVDTRVASEGQIEGRVVRFDDPKIEEQAGISTAKAVKAEGSAAVACSAELRFNANKLADIRAIVPGVVRQVQVELGQSVEEGDPLFVLESTRIGDIQAELQTARERVRTAKANLQRQRELRADDISSARQVEVAENELASAEAAQRSASTTLRMAGAGKTATSGRYTLRSPIAGEIVRRPAVVGVLATDEESLATVADTATMWAICAIGERDANRVSKGHSLRLDLGGGESAIGVVTWVSPEVDPRTRMVSARAEVSNENGRLRANQFLDATIIAGAPRSSVMVPRDAVQRVEGREVVFLRARAGTYLPRVVERYGEGDPVAVRGKIEPGDEVVVEGAVLLRTEVLPGSIGAGCCEVEPPSTDEGDD